MFKVVVPVSIFCCVSVCLIGCKTMKSTTEYSSSSEKHRVEVRKADSIATESHESSAIDSEQASEIGSYEIEYLDSAGKVVAKERGNYQRKQNKQSLRNESENRQLVIHEEATDSTRNHDESREKDKNTKTESISVSVIDKALIVIILTIIVLICLRLWEKKKSI